MTMTTVTIRAAMPNDAAAIAEIYNQGIRERIATFETEERTPEERRQWLANHDAAHPVVVATAPGADGEETVVGWASTDSYRPRACYAGIAEFSVYVHAAYRGRGIGIPLMQGLLTAAERAGLWKLVSRVFTENAASRALLARVGFREVGVYEKHGKLDGIWRDCVIVERLIPANL